MNNQADLSDQWRDYRSRVRWFTWLLASGFPVAALVALSLTRPTLKLIVLGAALLWLIGLVVAVARLQFFPCPNCGRPFAFKYLNDIPALVKACKHCGLEKWQH